MPLLFNIEPANEKSKDNVLFLDFSNNWNGKLNCFSFTTIRSNSNKYKIDDEVVVRLKNIIYCKVILIKIRTLSINEIIEEGIHITDTGLNNHEFYELLKSFYSKKIWWKNKETKMNILFFKKIKQLDLFADTQ